MSFTARKALQLLVISFILLPVSAYIAGNLVVGEYTGASGLAGFMGTIYADATRGSWTAWALLGAPSLWVAIWLAVRAIHRRQRS
jgi:hypothetical protein